MPAMNEKMLRRVQDEAGAMVLTRDQPGVTRNGIKATKRRAKSRHGDFSLGCAMSYGVTASIGAQAELLQGSTHQENPSDYSKEAQERKMRKAAEKRARRAGHFNDC